MKVEVEVSQKAYDVLMEKLPWLGYEDPEVMAQDAVYKRVEDLFLLAVPS